MLISNHLLSASVAKFNEVLGAAIVSEVTNPESHNFGDINAHFQFVIYFKLSPFNNMSCTGALLEIERKRFLRLKIIRIRLHLSCALPLMCFVIYLFLLMISERLDNFLDIVSKVVILISLLCYIYCLIFV